MLQDGEVKRECMAIHPTLVLPDVTASSILHNRSEILHHGSAAFAFLKILDCDLQLQT